MCLLFVTSCVLPFSGLDNRDKTHADVGCVSGSSEICETEENMQNTKIRK